VSRRQFRPPPYLHRPSLVVPVRVDPTGINGPTRAEARGPRWRRSSHGLYVPAEVVVTDEQQILEAAAVLPRYGAVTGWAGLRWLGARWFTGDPSGRGERRAVDLAISRESDIRRQPGMRLCQEPWSPYDVVVVDGVPVTVPKRSVAFEMRYAESLWKAVTAADMAAYDDLVSLEELSVYAGHAPRFGLSAWTGIPQCREAILLADENSWSPRETWLRLVWVRVAGLPTPLMNHAVFDLEGRHIATPDLLDDAAGVAGQYDSALHLDRDARLRDARRDDALRRVGIECFSVVTGETAGAVAERMLGARGRALAHRRPRLWTAEPPAWWTSTVTVEQRRALADRDRARLLRYRESA
jgi:hypothetical protein